MSLLAHFIAFIEELKYAGVPEALPARAQRVRPAGALGPNQLAWLDENMCLVGGEHKFRAWRLQAEAARAH